MSWLHKTLSTYGRLPNKPENGGKVEEISEEAVPIQDQIENLRAKISLKERYNRALQDDLNESHQGTTVILQDLSKETKDLRQSFVDAINSEKAAVQNALRTHRQFQLALTNRSPSVSIPWLNDKLFDMSKLLNQLLGRLKEKRGKLEDSEEMVMAIEKWPRPGTLPWEAEASIAFDKLECLIESQKVKRETAFILNSKYYLIKIHLSGEKGKYGSILKNSEVGLVSLRQELSNLQMMLDDAMQFRQDAYKNLILTEKEASENRKRRRKQMGKMKKAVEKILEENHMTSTKPKVQEHIQSLDNSHSPHVSNSVLELSETLRLKRAEVEDYQDRAKRLVDVMRVPDLTHIPPRLKLVDAVGERLREEQQTKEKLRDECLKKKNQLMLILQHHRYTGAQQLKDFTEYNEEYTQAIKLVENRKKDLQKRLDYYGGINVHLRQGLIALHERINEDKRKVHHLKNEDMKTQMKTILNKTKNLVKSVEDLKALFKGKAAERNYEPYVKNPHISHELIRVGTPAVSEDSDAEDDLTDAKVPGRTEIKAKSLRIMNQAILKRGIH